MMMFLIAPEDSVINMSADPVPLLEPSKPERMVGAAANTLPSDMPLAATWIVLPGLKGFGIVTRSDWLMMPSPLRSNCGLVKLPPVA